MASASLSPRKVPSSPQPPEVQEAPENAFVELLRGIEPASGQPSTELFQLLLELVS